MRPTALLALAALLASPLAADEDAAPPRIYRWVDQNGVAHYTTDLERVPEELREQPLRREELSANAPAAADAWIRQERIPEPPSPSVNTSAASTDRAAALDARIAELEQAIAADEELLKGQLIDDAAVQSNDALREVAGRMPARIQELQKLKAEREALGAPSRD
ncbi:MAG: hypothetical protein FJ091_14075 [Deltaproteobacteria bacterium]|nr:hypothetical protein [Deltaproteobacteria bacterium]